MNAMDTREYVNKEKERYDSLVEFGSLDAYLPGCTSWAATLPPWAQSPYRALERGISTELQPGSDVLDYGCYVGSLAVALANNGFRVTGLDISDRAIEYAKRRAMLEASRGRLSFMVGDCEATPFAARTFDAVVSTGVLSSLAFERGLQEMARVVKDDGIVYVVDTLEHHPIARLSRWLKYKRGVRTEHAFRHILSHRDVGQFKDYFKQVEIEYFDLTTLLVGMLPTSIGRPAVPVATSIDRLLLDRLPLIRKYAFKVFLKLRNPIRR